MAVQHLMAAALFKEKTQQKLTGQLPMRRAILQKTLLQAALLKNVRFRLLMPLALQLQFQSMSILMVRALYQMPVLRRYLLTAISWIYAPKESELIWV